MYVAIVTTPCHSSKITQCNGRKESKIKTYRRQIIEVNEQKSRKLRATRRMRTQETTEKRRDEDTKREQRKLDTDSGGEEEVTLGRRGAGSTGCTCILHVLPRRRRERSKKTKNITRV